MRESSAGAASNSASKKAKGSSMNGGAKHTLSSVLSNSNTNTAPSSGTPHAAAAPAMCLATPYDPTGLMWTAEGPTDASLSRIRKFAASSAALITELVLSHREEQTSTQKERQEEGQRASREGGEQARSSARWLSLFCTPLRVALDGALLLAGLASPHPGRLMFPAHKLLTAANGKGTAVGVPNGGAGFEARGSLAARFRDATKILHEEAVGEGEGEGRALGSAALSSEREPLAVVGFRPLQSMVDMLRAKFGESVTVLYDCHGGTDAVGVLAKGALRKAGDGEGKWEKRAWDEVLAAMQTECGDLVSAAVCFK